MEAISVTKLNTIIKQIFDAEELLHNIPVVGEVFGVNITRNVLYFSLKDSDSTLPCVCFYPNYFDLVKEGDKVIVTGSPNYYVKGGRLNFNVNKVESAGQGKLYEEFLKLKEKLQSEGLFDASHKKKLPSVIKRIGVITSREGAVIQDIKNVAWRRNPTVDIVLYNTRVQGVNAESEIARAIENFSHYENIDVIVVARGGGSLEDLWAYNTEAVARATYNCQKPIISAVGHETDFTIIDFVSDLRAPTPSAAAELLTFNLQEKKANAQMLFDSFYKVCKNYLNSKINQYNITKLRLASISENLLSYEQNRVFNLKNQLIKNYSDFINQKYYETGLIETTLNKINPTNVLKQGYAKLEQNKKAVNKLDDLDRNQAFTINFIDGRVDAKTIDNKE